MPAKMIKKSRVPVVDTAEQKTTPVKYIGSRTYTRWQNPSGRRYIFEGLDKICEVLEEDLENFKGGPFEILKPKKTTKKTTKKVVSE